MATGVSKSDKSPSKEVKKSPESVKKEKKPEPVVAKKPEVSAKPQKNAEVSEKKKATKKASPFFYCLIYRFFSMF